LGEVTDARFHLQSHPSWAKNKKLPGLEPSARPAKNHGKTRVGHLLVNRPYRDPSENAKISIKYPK
jgi:hypothetical protein